VGGDPALAEETHDPPGTQVISYLSSCLAGLGRPWTAPLRPL
jgi:hypothetical protein